MVRAPTLNSKRSTFSTLYDDLVIRTEKGENDKAYQDLEEFRRKIDNIDNDINLEFVVKGDNKSIILYQLN